MSNRIERYLTALADQVQPTEEGLTQLLRERGVDVAVGQQLDDAGRKVGQARGGLNDQDFRRFIRSRISANKSSGAINDILRVATGVIGDDDAVLFLQQQPPAAFVLRIDGIAVDAALGDILAKFIRDTAAAGVRSVVEFSPSAPAQILIMSLSDGSEPGQGTLGISTDPDEGADLSRARV